MLLHEVTAQTLREILGYDEITGIFTWRAKPADAPHAARWNAKTAGNCAGHVTRRGYLAIGLGGRIYQAHRLAWLYVYGEWPPTGIDHIDRRPGNNAISNLRLATHMENCANRSLPSNNRSGVKGVHWNGKVGKWRAGIRVDRKMLHLGHFANIEAAANAYEQAAKKHFGDFSTGVLRRANTN